MSIKYINRLNEEDWNQIFKGTGIKLDVNNVNKSTRPCIDRRNKNDLNERDHYLLHVIDSADAKTNFIKYMRETAGMPIKMIKDSYDACSDLVEAEDFLIKKLSFFIENKDDEKINQKLQNNFTSYLKNKFPSYEKDYNNYLASLEPEMAD